MTMKLFFMALQSCNNSIPISHWKGFHLNFLVIYCKIHVTRLSITHEIRQYIWRINLNGFVPLDSNILYLTL